MFSGLALSVLAIAVGFSPTSTAQFNNPPGVDIWCGKAYRASNSSFDPGGWFHEPPTSDEPLLRLYARPRMNYYLDTESKGTVLVDAAIVHQVGEPLPAGINTKSHAPSSSLRLEVSYGGEIVAKSTVKLGSIANEITVDLAALGSGYEARNVTVVAKLGKHATYETTAEVFRFPYPEDRGSIVRLDNLYGGISGQRGKEGKWEKIFPYSYYTQWTLYWNEDGGAAEGNPDVDTLNEFSDMGYNIIHIVPTGSLGDTPFPWDQLMPYIERADELGLWIRYDVMWHGGSSSGALEQVETLKDHPSILSWYLTDEPDGQGRNFTAAQDVYNSIRSVDPFHPVSLVLNCWDFYYEEYSRAADIVSSDVYQVSNNNTYSEVYHTVCNTTYGCCGCDNCEGNFDDVSRRVDEFYRRDELLLWEKAQWTVPQAFGNETFWPRYPTAAELVVQTVVGINHGSKGIVQWNYNDLLPADLEAITRKMAQVFTSDTFGDFVLGAPLHKALSVDGDELIDATAWVDQRSGKVLLGVVNKRYKDVKANLKVSLPSGIKPKAIDHTLWGDAQWKIHGDQLVSEGLLGLQVSIFIVDATL